MHLAARLGKRRVLAEMLSKEPNLDPTWTDGSCRNSIHYAAAGGSVEALQIMLDLLGDRKTSDILDARDNHGTTALHFACEFNFSDVVKMLLANGASHKIQNDAGLYAIHTAAKKGSQSLEVILGLPDCVHIDVRDSEGLSSLMIACLHGNDAGATTLLEKGADATVTDADGMGLAHACVEAADPRLLKMVVAAGARVRCKDGSGSEPIHLAASSGNVACLEVLMACDMIDLNALDGEGRSALHLACVGGHAHFVETLIKDKRVNVNLVNSAGFELFVVLGFHFLTRLKKKKKKKKKDQTALHLASQNGKLDVVKVLLNLRPDLDIVKVFVFLLSLFVV